MKTTHHRFARQPLSALGRLTAATLLATATIFGAMLLFVLNDAAPMLIPPVLVLLIGAAVIATGWRWTPLVGTALLGLLSVALLAPSIGMIVQELRTPGMPMGPLLMLLIPTMLIGASAGVATTVQNYRRAPAERRAPRWLALVLCAIIGLSVGAAGLHAMAAPAGGAGVSQEVLATLPAVATKNFAFDQRELRVKAGELAALRLTNADEASHSFDVDALNVHTLMLPGQDAVALFRPNEPGSYTFYCAPHYNPATGEGMRGTLIVTP